MLQELRFVQGAVAKKEIIPAMTHFAIEGGFVRAYNGSLALCAPIAFDIDCKPKAVPLVNAIRQLPEEGTPLLSMTPSGKLAIKCGSFRSYIDCVTEETPHVLPEGERVDFDGEAMLAALKVLEPFIGSDASRPWCNGVLMRGQSLYATNNVVLVEYWTGVPSPLTVNIPRVAIHEMLRIDEAPTYAQLTDTSITFHYADQRWIRSQLLDVKWPDLDPLLNTPNNATDIDPRIFEGLERIEHAADKIGRVFIGAGSLSTAPKADLEEGCKWDIPELQFEGIYQIKMLLSLKGVAKQMDFTLYPKPCIFYGDKLRGAIVGMRM